MQTPLTFGTGDPVCPACGQAPLLPVGRIRDHSVSGETFGLLACRACGLRKTDPHPAPSGIGKYYASGAYVSHSDTRAGTVNKLYHLARNFMLGRKSAWVRRASGYSRGRLLDVGAGTGYFAAFMRDRGWSVTALEPDATARQAASSRAGLEIRPIEDLEGLTAETFDVITLWHVLEHVHDPAHYLDRFRNLLVPGGMLMIAVPNPESRDAIHYGTYWAAWDVPRHLWHFSPSSLKHLLQQHGFTKPTQRTMPLDAFYVSMLSEKYKGNSGVAGLVCGIWNGLRTCLSALRHQNRASSMIYFSRPIRSGD